VYQISIMNKNRSQYQQELTLYIMHSLLSQQVSLLTKTESLGHVYNTLSSHTNKSPSLQKPSLLDTCTTLSPLTPTSLPPHKNGVSWTLVQHSLNRVSWTLLHSLGLLYSLSSLQLEPSIFLLSLCSIQGRLVFFWRAICAEHMKYGFIYTVVQY
jgi:hypothetical protein